MTEIHVRINSKKKIVYFYNFVRRLSNYSLKTQSSRNNTNKLIYQIITGLMLVTFDLTSEVIYTFSITIPRLHIKIHKVSRYSDANITNLKCAAQLF